MKYLACLAFTLLSGCATILGGTSQVVSVATSPPGATCTIDRLGSPVGTIAATPGLLRVSKTGSDLTVTCSKPGYQSAQVGAASSFNGLTFVNLAIGGLVGVVVDASSGANFDYPPVVSMALRADPAAGPVRAGQEDRAYQTVQARVTTTTRMMAAPDPSRAKQAFLLGACSAGDETACILTEDSRQGGVRSAGRVY